MVSFCFAFGGRGGRPLGLPDWPGPRIFAVFSLLAAMLLPPFSTPIISPPLPYFSYRIAAAFSFPGQLVGGLSCFRVKCSPTHRSPYWSCCTPIGGPSFLCSHFLTLPAAATSLLRAPATNRILVYSLSQPPMLHARGPSNTGGDLLGHNYPPCKAPSSL